MASSEHDIPSPGVWTPGAIPEAFDPNAHPWGVDGADAIAPAATALSTMTSMDGVDGVDVEALRASALRRARWLIEFYSITRDEIEAAVSAPPPVEAETAEPAALPVKYRHPVTGETWDGTGPHPPWMRKALLQDGYRVAELRVAELSF